MMLSVLTGFFLYSADAHWGWWMLFWLAFFAQSITTFILSMYTIVKRR
jgi:hypothetical protein